MGRGLCLNDGAGSTIYWEFFFDDFMMGKALVEYLKSGVRLKGLLGYKIELGWGGWYWSGG